MENNNQLTKIRQEECNLTALLTSTAARAYLALPQVSDTVGVGD